MTLNETQKAALKKYLRGEPVESVSTGVLASMYTALCDVCGRTTIYPLLIGVGPSVQVFNDRESYAQVCGLCVDELKKEHFRRTAYEELFK